MAVEALVGFIVERLVSLAADAIARRLRAAWGLEEELAKLQRHLKRIQSMLADAEEKQTVDPAVRSWLDALKKVAYEAEDVLDDLNYEILRHKAAEEVAGRRTPCSGKVRDFFSSHNPILFRSKVGSKLNNLLEEVAEIAAESTAFNFSKVDAQPETAAPVETCSFVEESEIVGRRGAKEELVQLLTNDDRSAEKVSVLPIVGMPGLGKTAMAQLVYGDPRVVAYFQLRAWVCVSDHWDAKRIMQEILISFATKTKIDQSSSMERLHLALLEALSQKLFLIVLDDVWEEDPSKWDTLKGILNSGSNGSVVIVTTRSDRVAEITRTLQTYRLPYLSKDESWDLFSKRAFATGAEQPEELVKIGKAIANKCGGLPLALRMLGSLLYMQRDKSRWLNIEESNIWNTETGILPALRLSYKNLPSRSKQCFTFCAMFPKDFEMEKDTLINLWMAHGFISSDGGRLEAKGNEIFNQLVQRSFLQDVKEEKVYCRFSYLIRTSCRMHDLVHDLALSIMGNECVALLPTRPSEVVVAPNDAYHLSISPGITGVKDMLKASPNLRTTLSLLSIHDGANLNITGSTSLRVLTLGYARRLTSMKFLQHLRYLQLESPHLSELPESICTLFNLQTLDLSGCVSLRRLPKKMSCMISLRHLYLDCCETLTRMVPGMGRMTNLQTLTLYIVGEETGLGIGELKELRLASRLELKSLESVKDAKEAREVNLHSKDLNLLTLGWTTRGGGEEVSTLEEQVLEELEPPGCLKFLEIFGYSGLKCPTWMADRLLLQHLVELRLRYCTGLDRLPPLWHLCSLQELSLEYMNGLKYIVSDSAAGDATFGSLKELKLDYLERLEGWWENKNVPLEEAMAGCFPALVRLGIRKCPEMASSLPLAPCLEWLALEGIKKIPLGSISTLTSLVTLKIENYGEEEPARDPVDSSRHHERVDLRQLQRLEELDIRKCGELALVWWQEDDEQEGGGGSGRLPLKKLTLMECDWMFSSPTCSRLWTSMASLESLTIIGCHALVALPYQLLQGLDSLRSLHISNCSNMTDELSATAGASCLLPQLEDLRFGGCSRLEAVPPIWVPSLKQLIVGGCPNLVSLAAAEQDLGRFTSLETLILWHCPRLKSLDGDLSALRRLTVEDCTDLTSLPEGVLPTLKSLAVRGCPRLGKKCSRRGRYWSLISHIPDCTIES